MNDRQTSMWIPHAKDYTPLERVILTANGNLQRILSAYYDLPVSVEVIKCEKIGNMTFLREVLIVLQKPNEERKIICHVQGTICVNDQSVLEAIESGRVGVGQLFRYLRVLPVFRLHDAGFLYVNPSDISDKNISTSTLKNIGSSQKKMSSVDNIEGGGKVMWRDYELTSDQLTCRFTETFSPGFLSFHQD
jgi:hypothetical protein